MWSDVLNQTDAMRAADLADADIDAGGGVALNPADDGFLMTSGLKNASKCRTCSKTLDIGTPAWFNKEGEPGRKVTCQECHQKTYGDMPNPADEKNKVEEKTKTAKKPKKLAPKFSHELLLDHKKGMVSVYKNFQNLKWKGKGHEASDLRRLMAKYAEWAHILVPDMPFSEFIQRLEKGNSRMLHSKLEQIRNVQQGFCTIEDIEDYSLADRADPLGADAEADPYTLGGDGEADPFADDNDPTWGDGVPSFEEEEAMMMGGGGGTRAAPAAAAAGGSGGGMTEEQRARMERNKQAALAKAAAKKAAQAAANGAPTAEEEEMEFEMEFFGGNAQKAAPNNKPAAGAAEDGIDEFDEEAEAMMFPGSMPPPSAAAVRTNNAAAAAAHDGPPPPFDEFEEEMAFEAEMEAEAMGGGGGAPARQQEAATAPSQFPDEFTFNEPIGEASQTIGQSDLTYNEPAAAATQSASAPFETADLTFREPVPPEEAAEADEADARAAAQAQAEALEAGFDDDDEL